MTTLRRGFFTDANSRRCFRSNTGGGVINATFNNAIKPYLSNSLPTPNNTVFGSGSSPWATRGAWFQANSSMVIDGVANPWKIDYTLEGVTKCPVGPLISTSSWPNLSWSVSPANGYTTLLAGGTVGVECTIPMPDPTKL